MSPARILIAVLLCFSPALLFAQTPLPPPLPPPPAPSNPWEQASVSLGLQMSSGESTYVAFNFAVDWAEQFTNIESDLMANASISQSEGSKIFDAEGLDWSVRWTPVARKNHLFPMAHVWFERGELTGIDFRGTAGPGLGSHIVDTPKVRLTLEGGFARTIERHLADSEYNTLYFNPTLRWNINKTVSLKQKMAGSLNTEERDDVRVHSETDLNFQLTRTISLSNTVLIDFDSDPVPGHRHTYVQSSINLSISIYRGTRPQ